MSINAERGREFEVELESYAGSGAKWQFASESDAVRLIGESTKQRDQSIGSGTVQTFKFQSDTPGTHRISFELKRAWEPAARGRKEFLVEVS